MMGRGREPIRSLAPMAAAALLGMACDDGPIAVPGDPAPPAISLAIVSGDSQTGETGRLLEEFLVFRVTDAAGLPVVGLPVDWEVVAGGGQVSGKRHETDLDGLGAGNFTLGPGLGVHVANAVVRDSHSIEFTAFAVPPSSEEEPLP
jgi:hypothetical protein